MKIYISNLSFQTSETELRMAFERFGIVSSAVISVDRVTKKSKGIGFVTMDNDEEAKIAIENLDGYELNQRILRVDEARASGNAFKQNRNSRHF